MKGNMKYTTVKISEIAKHPTLRLDPKYWIKRKIKKSRKLQAPSLTVTEGYYRMSLKGINMDTIQLKRIADALEEILRLVKKDMEPRTKKKEK